VKSSISGDFLVLFFLRFSLAEFIARLILLNVIKRVKKLHLSLKIESNRISFIILLFLFLFYRTFQIMIS
jgi:hypothetical protein